MIQPVPGQDCWTKTDTPNIEPPVFVVSLGRNQTKRRKGKFEVPGPKRTFDYIVPFTYLDELVRLVRGRDWNALGRFHPHHIGAHRGARIVKKITWQDQRRALCKGRLGKAHQLLNPPW